MKLKHVVLSLPLLCSSLLPAQNGDLRTTVLDLTQQIQAAVDSGDLPTAMNLYGKLGDCITHEFVNRQPAAAQKLAQLEAKYASESSERGRFYALLGLPGAAYDAGEYYKAEQYATLLLDSASQRTKNQFYGEAIFAGNTVRGRLLLQHKDSAGAKAALAASIGPAVESGSARTSRLDTGLAQDLLNAGEREAVIQFLSSCKPFSARHRETLDLWIATIKGGGNPQLAQLF